MLHGSYNGPDVPLMCAVGVGTSRAVEAGDIAAIEAFYRSRKSLIRIAISGRTHDGSRDDTQREDQPAGGSCFAEYDLHRVAATQYRPLKFCGIDFERMKCPK